VNLRAYLNTSTLSATSRIDGGGSGFPTARAYSDVILRFRLARELEGEQVPDDREVLAVSARIGYADRRPTSGNFELRIEADGDAVETGPIAHDASAAEVKALVDAALTAGETPPLDYLAPVRVLQVSEGWKITFADQEETVDVSASDNELWPLSFVEADRIGWDGGWSTVVSLAQAPAAESTGLVLSVPPLPSVSREQGGSTEEGVAINEIQKIALSPAYAGGVWRLVLTGRKSRPIPGFPTLEQLEEALGEIVPEGGAVRLLGVEDGALVEFLGGLAGEPVDLLDVEEFLPPPPEHVVKLSTRTAAMRSLMAGASAAAPEVELPFDMVVTVADDDAPGGEQTIFFPLTLTFTRPVSDDGRNVSAELDWTQPLARRSNAKFSPSALLIGNRAKRFVIGDGTATQIDLQHNLGLAAISFSANSTTDVLTAAGHNFSNLDPLTLSTTGTLPAPLIEGATYFVRAATADTFELALTPNGSKIDLTTTGTGTHTAALADGSADGVDVSLWEASGDQARLGAAGYAVRRLSADAIRLTFSAAPTTGQYVALVQSYGRPATYQAHQHPLDDSPETRARIEAIEARLAALEAGNFGGGPPPARVISGAGISRLLPPVWRVPRARVLPPPPTDGGLYAWDPYGGESPLRDLRLLPAVHRTTGSVESLPSPLPVPANSLRDRVFVAATARPEFPGGGLLAGEHAACDGREWYRVRREDDAETTWYPTAYEMELFRLSVSPDELALRTALDLAIGFEAALYDPRRRTGERRTVARASLLIERGVRTATTSPATTGSNIDAHFSSPVVLVRHDFDITEVPAARRFGLRIARAGDGVITATATKFSTQATVSPPASADFSLRARIVRFDVQDLPTDGRGVLAVRGLDVGLDGAQDPTLGRWTIG
jgi:hypothetical protein